jgi:hypothetical protein
MLHPTVRTLAAMATLVVLTVWGVCFAPSLAPAMTTPDGWQLVTPDDPRFVASSTFASDLFPRRATGPAVRRALVVGLRDELTARYGSGCVVQYETTFDLRVAIKRRDILLGRGYHEYVVLTMTTREAREGVYVHLVAEGFYAPGIGRRTPRQGDYKSMEPRYYHELTAFTTTVMQLVRSA